MKRALVALSLATLAGCTVGNTMPGPGSNGGGPDAGTQQGTPDAPPAAACTIPTDLGSPGTLAGAVAEQHNQPGSMGALKYYRLYAPLPGGTADATDVLMLELWDGAGPFTGGTVQAGTYPIAGADTAISTCGLCMYVLGDVDATGTPKQVYLAQSGTVNVTSVGGDGATFSATISGIGAADWDMTTQAVSTDGCATTLTQADMSGTVTVVSGGGGGTGGGGG